MSLQTTCRLLVRPNPRYYEITFIVNQFNPEINETSHVLMLRSHCELYYVHGLSKKDCVDQKCRISLEDHGIDQYGNLLYNIVLYIYDDSDIPAFMFMGPAIIYYKDLNHTIPVYDIQRFMREISDWTFLIVNEYYKETGKEKIEEYIDKLNNCEIILQSK